MAAAISVTDISFLPKVHTINTRRVLPNTEHIAACCLAKESRLGSKSVIIKGSFNCKLALVYADIFKTISENHRKPYCFFRLARIKIFYEPATNSNLWILEFVITCWGLSAQNISQIIHFVFISFTYPFCILGFKIKNNCSTNKPTETR